MGRNLPGSGTSRCTNSTGTVRGTSRRNVYPAFHVSAKGEDTCSKLVVLLLQPLEGNSRPWLFRRSCRARPLDNNVLRLTAHHNFGESVAP